LCRYYRGTHGVIIVYDVTNGESFANVKRWLHEIDQNCDMVNKVLVGNKNDDPSRKVVLTTDAQRFADQMGIQLFETSAKDNINVEEVCIYGDDELWIFENGNEEVLTHDFDCNFSDVHGHNQTSFDDKETATTQYSRVTWRCSY